MKVEYDPESWHREVLVSFEICLETLELKHIALELLKEEVIKLNNDLKELNKDKKNNYSHYKYEIIEKTKYFVECIFDIYCSLNEIDKAISYYHKYHPKEVNDEIK